MTKTDLDEAGDTVDGVELLRTGSRRPEVVGHGGGQIRTEQALPGLTGRHVAALQAAFYISTGVWPVLHRKSFERVTGSKVDFWLAQTVGVTVASIGAGLAHSASRRRQVSPELRTVAMTSAAGLMLVDLIYVARRRISPIYLLDAAAEAALVTAWALAGHPRMRRRTQSNGPFPIDATARGRVSMDTGLG